MSSYYLHPEGGWKANCAAALLTVVYVKVLIALCDAAVSAGFVPKDVSRKIVHIGAASWMLFWPLFDPTHGTWRLNVLVPAVFSVQLVYKGAIKRDPNDTDVKTMSRTGDPRELLYGPFLFTLCMNCMGLFLFRKEEAVYCMAALGYGDGLAPLVGSRWPLARFRCPGGVKSAGGCLAVFLGTVLGYMVFSKMLGVPESTDWGKVCAVAIWATIVEGLSPGDYDNIAIPTVVYSYEPKHRRLSRSVALIPEAETAADEYDEDVS